MEHWWDKESLKTCSLRASFNWLIRDILAASTLSSCSMHCFRVISCSWRSEINVDAGWLPYEKKIQDKKNRAHKSAVKLYSTVNIHNTKYEQEMSLPLVLASFISLFILSKTPTVLLHLFKAVSSSKCWSRTDWYAVTIFSGIPPTISFYSKSQQIRRCSNIQPNKLDLRRRVSNLLLLLYQNPSVKLWNLKGD